MTSIFPPTGSQDQTRSRLIKNDRDREYLWFCLEFCGRVLERRPIHLEALELAANHFTSLGYFHDGLRLDERLAALHPRDPGILYNLSCSLALTGQPEEALRRLTLAVECGYSDYEHMSTDRDLAAIHGDNRFHALLQLAASHKGEAGPAFQSDS